VVEFNSSPEKLILSAVEEETQDFEWLWISLPWTAPERGWLAAEPKNCTKLEVKVTSGCKTNMKERNGLTAPDSTSSDRVPVPVRRECDTIVDRFWVQPWSNSQASLKSAINEDKTVELLRLAVVKVGNDEI